MTCAVDVVVVVGGDGHAVVEVTVVMLVAVDALGCEEETTGNLG